MNPPSFSRIEVGVLGKKIRFDDFDISWAGENANNKGYLFGSEDGRIRTLGVDGDILTSPSISPSGEAVNGVALSGRVTAVSTRAEVAFVSRGDVGESILHFDGGAHEIITISSGGFIAPLGHNGLLTMMPADGPEQLLATAKLDSHSSNLYQLAHCNGDGRSDLVVGAARRDGLLVMEFETLSDRITLERSQFVKSPALDVVGVCSLGSALWPNAVAWLGADRSIHLSRDILKERESKSLRINELQGSAYTLLHAQGHLFLLTNKAVYIFPCIVNRYLEDETISDLAPVISVETDLVDIYVSEKTLFLIAVDHVNIIPIESLILNNKTTHSDFWTPNFINEVLSNPSEEPAWNMTSVA